MRERREPRVVIVGAGVAGITALHVFRERGFADVTVLEKGSDVGRVWYWNRYPGLTCDVPSQLYQFRFAPKPDWSRVWADGAEIQRYHRRVVDDLGLAGHIRTDTEVAAARWDGGTATWELTLAARDGATVAVVARTTTTDTATTTTTTTRPSPRTSSCSRPGSCTTRHPRHPRTGGVPWRGRPHRTLARRVRHDRSPRRCPRHRLDRRPGGVRPRR